MRANEINAKLIREKTSDVGVDMYEREEWIEGKTKEERKEKIPWRSLLTYPLPCWKTVRVKKRRRKFSTYEEDPPRHWEREQKKWRRRAWRVLTIWRLHLFFFSSVFVVEERKTIYRAYQEDEDHRRERERETRQRERKRERPVKMKLSYHLCRSGRISSPTRRENSASGFSSSRRCKTLYVGV